MAVADQQLAELRKQIVAGFLISQHTFQSGVHTFTLPALEYGVYQIGVPDGPAVQTFLQSREYHDARMQPFTVGVVLLDLIGFSSQPDETQLMMIVRYQVEVRKVIADFPIRKKISIGDGTIFVFDQSGIGNLPQYMYEIDHALAGFNLDFMGDDVPEIRWRMGVHVGDAYMMRDINGDENYIGTGINLAQRVSACVPDPGADVAPEASSTIYVSEQAYQAIQAAGIPAGFHFFDAGQKTVKKTILNHVYAMTKVTPA
jgi:class 3 adenylate cyclase